MAFDRPFIAARCEASARAIAALALQAPDIERLALAVRAGFDAGHHLYTCGNGGSAAQAMHLAEELIGKYKRPRRPYPAVCLNADPTALTCIANDFGYDHVFARQLDALARSGDTLVVFSTSGNSPNIVRALEVARARRVTTIGLLGKGGGACAPLCDFALIAGAPDTETIQESHQVILHLILEAVESAGA